MGSWMFLRLISGLGPQGCQTKWFLRGLGSGLVTSNFGPNCIKPASEYASLVHVTPHLPSSPHDNLTFKFKHTFVSPLPHLKNFPQIPRFSLPDTLRNCFCESWISVWGNSTVLHDWQPPPLSMLQREVSEVTLIFLSLPSPRKTHPLCSKYYLVSLDEDLHLLEQHQISLLQYGMISLTWCPWQPPKGWCLHTLRSLSNFRWHINHLTITYV